jgi:hypothetical protein
MNMGEEYAWLLGGEGGGWQSVGGAVKDLKDGVHGSKSAWRSLTGFTPV